MNKHMQTRKNNYSNMKKNQQVVSFTHSNNVLSRQKKKDYVEQIEWMLEKVATAEEKKSPSWSFCSVYSEIYANPIKALTPHSKKATKNKMNKVQ